MSNQETDSFFRLLNCLHTICIECCQILMSKETILCPLCAAETRVPNSNIHAIPKYALASHLLNSNNGDPNRYCNHTPEQNERYCLTCKQFYCKECASTCTAKHESISIEQYRQMALETVKQTPIAQINAHELNMKEKNARKALISLQEV